MVAYSTYWRKHRSRHPTTELALGLKALRKVAGHLGPNVKPVFWKGMLETDRANIILDPSKLSSFPISPRIFDTLVGQVVLEGIASIEWSDWVKDRTLEKFHGQHITIIKYLNAIIETAEQIWVNLLPKSRTLSLYLERLLSVDDPSHLRDPTLPPSPSSLTSIWKKNVLSNQSPEKLHFYYYDLLRILNKSTISLKELVVIPSLKERREKRVDLYSQVLIDIVDQVSRWESFSADPDGIDIFDESAMQTGTAEGNPEPDEKNQEPDSDESKVDELTPEQTNELNFILEEESSLTNKIATVVQDPEASSLKTVFRKGVAEISSIAEIPQVKQLRAIFREQAALARRQRNRNVKRGLNEGKLDARRLFRVPIDGKAFKLKQSPGRDLFWQICIVADASASMAGRESRYNSWQMVEKTVAAIIQAAAGYENRVDVYAYQSNESQCDITKLYHEGKLYTVTPSGKTPSGQAIVASAMLLDQLYKNTLLIHITDGASNCGLKLSEAVKYCQNKEIDLFTIGCGCSAQTRKFLTESLPEGHVYFLKNITYLPSGLEYLFKKMLLNK